MCFSCGVLLKRAKPFKESRHQFGHLHFFFLISALTSLIYDDIFRVTDDAKSYLFMS